jgi:hypothetical protein
MEHRHQFRVFAGCEPIDGRFDFEQRRHDSILPRRFGRGQGFVRIGTETAPARLVERVAPEVEAAESGRGQVAWVPEVTSLQVSDLVPSPAGRPMPTSSAAFSPAIRGVPATPMRSWSTNPRTR